MNSKSVGTALVGYGVGIAGLGWFIYQMAPGMARPTLIAGVAGGALSVLWGVRWLAGRGRKVWPILTLLPVSFVLLSQTVTAWMGEGEGSGPASGKLAILMTLALAASVAMIMRVAYHGVFGPASAPGGKQPLPSAGAETSGTEAGAGYPKRGVAGRK